MKIYFLLIVLVCPLALYSQLSRDHYEIPNVEKKFFNIDGHSKDKNLRLDSIVHYWYRDGIETGTKTLNNEFVDNKISRIHNQTSSGQHIYVFRYMDEYIDSIYAIPPSLLFTRITYVVNDNILKSETASYFTGTHGYDLNVRYDYNENGLVSYVSYFYSFFGIMSGSSSSFESEEYFYDNEDQLDSVIFKKSGFEKKLLLSTIKTDLLKKELLIMENSRL